jgi:proline iminopeptidase
MMASIPEYNAYAQEVLAHNGSQILRRATKMEKKIWPIKYSELLLNILYRTHSEESRSKNGQNPLIAASSTWTPSVYVFMQA